MPTPPLRRRAAAARDSGVGCIDRAIVRRSRTSRAGGTEAAAGRKPKADQSVSERPILTDRTRHRPTAGVTRQRGASRPQRDTQANSVPLFLRRSRFADLRRNLRTTRVLPHARRKRDPARSRRGCGPALFAADFAHRTRQRQLDQDAPVDRGAAPRARRSLLRSRRHLAKRARDECAAAPRRLQTPRNSRHRRRVPGRFAPDQTRYPAPETHPLARLLDRKSRPTEHREIRVESTRRNEPPRPPVTRNRPPQGPRSARKRLRRFQRRHGALQPKSPRANQP